MFIKRQIFCNKCILVYEYAHIKNCFESMKLILVRNLQKSRTVNLNISLPYDLQSASAGGWM